MAKQQVQLGEGGATFFKLKELTKGQKIEGTYKGTLLDQYDNICHKLILADGSTGIINGCGKLNALMERVSADTSVEVVYKGMSAIEKGKWKGTKAHDFDVFADELAEATGSDENVPF